MISNSLYDIFLNPEICFEVVNNSDSVKLDNHSKSNFPHFNFFSFVCLSDLLVSENFPILLPKSIPNKTIFFAPQKLARKTPLSPSVNPPKFCIFSKGFDCVVPIQFLKFFTNSKFLILSSCACTTKMDFVFPSFLKEKVQSLLQKPFFLLSIYLFFYTYLTFLK